MISFVNVSSAKMAPSVKYVSKPVTFFSHSLYDLFLSARVPVIQTTYNVLYS